MTYSIMKATKSIVCLVVFAALGGFGAIDVVQSFQPVNVRPVSLKSVAGFGRVVNDANNAHVSPKFFVPHSVYCNGDTVPCSAAIVRAAAAAATRCNNLGANVAFRSACARFPTFLSASSSPEDDAKPLNSVWVQLYVDGEKAGRPAKVKLDIVGDVFDLAMAVKQVYSNDLNGISAPRLSVYTWDDVKFLKTLDPGEIVADLGGGDTSKTAFIVAAGNILPCKMEK
jgi:hypothetical protein